MRMPKRAKSLEGKLAASKALSHSEEAGNLQDELLEVYAEADAKVVE